MPDFLAALDALAPVSPDLRAALAAAVRREQLPARQLLLQPGQVAQRVYFVERGLVRGYALHEGREISSWFMPEGDFVISIVSFFTQSPSTEYLELLETSLLYSISYEQLRGLYRDFPEFNLFGRLLPSATTYAANSVPSCCARCQQPRDMRNCWPSSQPCFSGWHSSTLPRTWA